MSTINRHRGLILTLVIVLALFALSGQGLTVQSGVSIFLSGLTLAALYFLVAGGLSLIFGLMDVLNFAHGSLFMLGAYAGWTFYNDPRLIFNSAPLLLAFAAGLALDLPPPAYNVNRALQWIAGAVALGLGYLALRDFPIAKLVAVGSASLATVEAQEPLTAMLVRVVFALGAGLALNVMLRREKSPGASRGLITFVALLGAALVTLLVREFAEQFILALDSNIRFLLALVVGGVTGAILGALIEVGLIRPLYARPIYQVLLTLGLVFVFDQVVRAIWGHTGFLMDSPSFFNTPGKECPSDDLWLWFSQHCDSVMIMGRAFPSYRLFIILIGVLIAVVVAVILRRSRLGMIIRAGVQDSEMVEALGINVRRVFTIVFAMGAGIAGLGGVVAAPFLGVSPALALEFLLQAFIVVVVGGMGSIPGAAVGALLVGLARAYGDHLVLSGVQFPGMAEAISGSPAIARASTVLIMAIVLLIRPTGIFGKKE